MNIYIKNVNYIWSIDLYFSISCIMYRIVYRKIHKHLVIFFKKKL